MLQLDPAAPAARGASSSASSAASSKASKASKAAAAMAGSHAITIEAARRGGATAVRRWAEALARLLAIYETRRRQERRAPHVPDAAEAPA